MKRRYFVSFSFQDYNGHGQGNLDIERDYPIENHSDIQAIQQEIVDRTGAGRITVLYWKRYEIELLTLPKGGATL